MNVFRVFTRPLVVFTCASVLAFFTGCATNPPSAKSSAKPAPSVSTSPAPESKSVPSAHPPPVAQAAATLPAPAAANSEPAAAAPAAPEAAAPLPAVTVPVRHATIVGSQETSILLDNFTAFVSSVDGRKVEAGRNGWNRPLSLDIGHRILGVEFNRGVFLAKGQLEFDAVANARYELKYTTDAELFGKNSYCNFWVIDIASGQTVSLVSKAAVEKIPETPKQSLLP